MPLGARGTRGQVQRNDRKIAELRFEVAALAIEFRHTEAAHDARGLVARVDGNAGVAFAFGVVKEALVACDLDVVIGQLVEVSLRFLQADEVGLLFREPAEEPLARRGTDPTAVHGNDAHWANHSVR